MFSGVLSLVMTDQREVTATPKILHGRKWLLALIPSEEQLLKDCVLMDNCWSLKIVDVFFLLDQDQVQITVEVR